MYLEQLLAAESVNVAAFEPEFFSVGNDAIQCIDLSSDDEISFSQQHTSVHVVEVKKEPSIAHNDDDLDQPFEWETGGQTISSSSEDDNSLSRRRNDRVYVDGATIRVAPKPTGRALKANSRSKSVAVKPKFSALAKKRPLNDVQKKLPSKCRQPLVHAE